jgi:hypothetical protein
MGANCGSTIVLDCNDVIKVLLGCLVVGLLLYYWFSSKNPPVQSPSLFTKMSRILAWSSVLDHWRFQGIDEIKKRCEVTTPLHQYIDNMVLWIDNTKVVLVIHQIDSGYTVGEIETLNLPVELSFVSETELVEWVDEFMKQLIETVAVKMGLSYDLN